ncbi:MAG: hypothetical protein AABZ44_00870 [Elusimicrobiota bacterium]
MRSEYCRRVHIIDELRHHLPYSVTSVAVSICVLGVLWGLMGEMRFSYAARGLFHVFHPLHLLFSATTTAAMFWRYDKNLVKALIVGLLGSLVVCAASDIAIPYLAGVLLGVGMDLHICIIEHWQMEVPFAVFGIFLGIAMPSTIKTTSLSHSAHVFTSSMASILYLVSFGLTDWLSAIGMVFIYTLIAVVLPCCTSDIVFPLFLTSQPAHVHDGQGSEHLGHNH